MLNILKKMLEIRKYYTQAGNVINILSGEHQHNVNSLAFLSLFGYTLIELGELELLAATESIVNNLSFMLRYNFRFSQYQSGVFVVHNK